MSFVWKEQRKKSTVLFNLTISCKLQVTTVLENEIRNFYKWCLNNIFSTSEKAPRIFVVKSNRLQLFK
jgi:hypothetical protein